MLPNIITKISDFGAATLVENLLNMLERMGCTVFKKLGKKSYVFPKGVEFGPNSK
uniref:Uncharacterized protein n=1 Tax=Arundo donax TaxID=35708 RepID=A0A0A9BDU4_ARUDO